MNKDGITPVMQQFFRAKEQYPEAIVLFRLGDFYEMFFDDAVKISQLLSLTLTARGRKADGDPIPMAGVPHHAAGGYIARILEHGLNVAICEQIGDPSKIKGIVPREVVRVLTPALVAEPEALDAKKDNYLLSVEGNDEGWGFAALDYSRSELCVGTAKGEVELLSHIVCFEPREILLGPNSASLAEMMTKTISGVAIRMQDVNDHQTRSPYVNRQLNLQDLAFESLCTSQQISLVRLFSYVEQADPTASFSLARVLRHQSHGSLILDESAIRHLELVRANCGELQDSLLGTLDCTCTSMGARLFRRRLLSPSTDLNVIQRRHGCVRALLDESARKAVRAHLAWMDDLERLASRLSLGSATARDLGSLRDSLKAFADIKVTLQEMPDISERLPDDSADDLIRLLQDALVDEPISAGQQHDVLRDSYHHELSRLRQLSSSAKDVLLEFERQERLQTGINSLKVKYSRVFGYFIEVTRSHLAHVPPRYRRKQTVAGAERFMCEELSVIERELLEADEARKQLESELLTQLQSKLKNEVSRLYKIAHAAAEIDVHASWAEVAHRHNYIEPQVDASDVLNLKQCRHPVVERKTPNFVPNDIVLDKKSASLWLITGPNMAGKSTIMRQAALNVILAQAGGFVPCAEARIGIVDRLFTRVGASDHLSRGQSTFMVEMVETANILNHATLRSLVIVDEIGRGTGTLDGLSIAHAVLEYLHDVIGCRTLFATHFHQLCDVAEEKFHACNYNVAVSDNAGNLTFLHTLRQGASDRSYGVEVARLAGLPARVIKRATSLLQALRQNAEHGHQPQFDPSSLRDSHSQIDSNIELDTVATERKHQLLVELEDLDLERTTPFDALAKLHHWKKNLSN